MNLVDALRRSVDPLVSLVAVDGAEVVGHILFSPVSLEPDASGFLAFGLAPLAVIPAWQRRGIGSRLVAEGLSRCREAGAGAVFVLGEPAYYRRFGFVKAASRGFRSEYDVPEEAFMVVELQPGALQGRGGLVGYRPEFGAV